MRFRPVSTGRLGRLTAAAMLCAALTPALALAQTDADAGAISFEEVEDAYRSGDHETARRGLLTYAEDGRALAQYRLGYMMASGEGGPVDLVGAKTWLERAVAQDHKPALVLLARTYLSGNPEEADFARAAELLQAAVEDKSAEAGFYLGPI